MRGALADEGVKWIGNPAGAADADDGRAAVRRRPGDGHDRSRRARPAGRRRRAVAARRRCEPRPALHHPRGRRSRYITCGDDDSRAYAGRPPAALNGRPCALRQQARGARADGLGTVDDAGAALAELADTVVVTLASEGAMALHDGEVIRFAATPSPSRSTRPVPATSSRPPTSGPTCAAPSRPTGFAGRCSTRASR